MYAARHVSVTIRTRITEADYVEIDCGFDTPCWIWKGRRAKRYANIRVRGTQMSVHRAMYLQEVGPITSGHVVDHLCGETRCVNPNHLETKTIGDNVRRSTAFHPTSEQLTAIVSYTVPAHVLAAEYGISTRTIYAVRKRHREHQQPS